MKNKIKQYSISLSMLLILDVITTIYLLLNINGAVEINPILNMGRNLIFNVIFSHILALLAILLINYRIKKDKQQYNIKFTYISLIILNVYYLLFVLLNTTQIIIN